MNFLVYLLCQLTGHAFIYMPLSLLAMIGGLALPFFARYPLLRGLLVANFALSVLNILGGSFVRTALIYKLGETGQATVTGSYGTSTQYNSHNVVGYNVLLKTAAGQLVETSFEDDDFNVYPAHNSTTYPDVNDRFTVRYLPGHPNDFIIISNDDSAWASSLRCEEHLDALHEARRKYDFDTTNTTNRQHYVDAIHVVIDNKCYTDSIDLRKYYGDIDYAKAGRQ